MSVQDTCVSLGMAKGVLQRVTHHVAFTVKTRARVLGQFRYTFAPLPLRLCLACSALLDVLKLHVGVSHGARGLQQRHQAPLFFLDQTAYCVCGARSQDQEHVSVEPAMISHLRYTFSVPGTPQQGPGEQVSVHTCPQKSLPHSTAHQAHSREAPRMLQAKIAGLQATSVLLCVVRLLVCLTVVDFGFRQVVVQYACSLHQRWQGVVVSVQTSWPGQLTARPRHSAPQRPEPPRGPCFRCSRRIQEKHSLAAKFNEPVCPTWHPLSRFQCADGGLSSPLAHQAHSTLDSTLPTPVVPEHDIEPLGLQEQPTAQWSEQLPSQYNLTDTHNGRGLQAPQDTAQQGAPDPGLHSDSGSGSKGAAAPTSESFNATAYALWLEQYYEDASAGEQPVGDIDSTESQPVGDADTGTRPQPVSDVATETAPAATVNAEPHPSPVQAPADTVAPSPPSHTHVSLDTTQATSEPSSGSDVQASEAAGVSGSVVAEQAPASASIAPAAASDAGPPPAADNHAAWEQLQAQLLQQQQGYLWGEAQADAAAHMPEVDAAAHTPEVEAGSESFAQPQVSEQADAVSLPVDMSVEQAGGPLSTSHAPEVPEPAPHHLHGDHAPETGVERMQPAEPVLHAESDSALIVQSAAADTTPSDQPDIPATATIAPQAAPSARPDVPNPTPESHVPDAPPLNVHTNTAAAPSPTTTTTPQADTPATTTRDVPTATTSAPHARDTQADTAVAETTAHAYTGMAVTGAAVPQVALLAAAAVLCVAAAAAAVAAARVSRRRQPHVGVPLRARMQDALGTPLPNSPDGASDPEHDFDFLPKGTTMPGRWAVTQTYAHTQTHTHTRCLGLGRDTHTP